jgi:type III restriction enzyme
VDAIESGIVKLPRVPVADNLPAGDMPMYRNLWKYIGKRMPKKGRSKTGKLDPLDLPSELHTALYALYGHYAKTFEEWKRAGVDVPPVFIVVCNNTSTSQLVCDWISGWDRDEEDGERQHVHDGHLELFRNYDQHGSRLARPNTLLIDSEQLESGEARDANFRLIATPEIEQFKREQSSKL